MSSTDQAQEPTMEEILASIRRIISDEDDGSSNSDAGASKGDDAVMAELDDAGDDAFADGDDSDSLAELDVDDDDDVLELTNIVDDDGKDGDDASDGPMFDDDFDISERDDGDDGGSGGADVEFVDVEEPEPPVFAAEPAPASKRKAEPEPESLISSTTDENVADAFGRLASTLLTRDGNTRTLEELVQELLRPMLKNWLDENLPGVVEELVRQEIERVSRRVGR